MKKLNAMAAGLLLTLGAAAANAAALPDTPVPFKSGAGAMVDGVIYVGLGTAGQNWYKLDTKAESPEWQSVASFPAPSRDQAQAVAIGDTIYVLGGCGKATADATRISVSNEVWAYNTKDNTWQKVMTRSPVGLTGHTAFTADGKNIQIVGSVNKAIFDGYFEDVETATNAKDDALLATINAGYNGKAVKDYFFNKEVLNYDPATNLWTTLGTLPQYGTAGAAVAVDNGRVTVINGEKKPGLRTAVTVQFDIENYGAHFYPLPDLAPADGDKVQEGIAGAFAGVSDGVVLAAGGANFPGATANYAKGKNFAHEGCTKTWRDEIYALKDGAWSQAGTLPLPLGYGVTVQNGDEIILVGGETQGGTPTSQVMVMSWKDGKVVIE